MKMVIGTLVALLLILAVIIGFTNFLRATSLFYPERYPLGSWNPTGFDPHPEDVWFESKDGTRLHGWMLEATSPRATLVWSHGNAGNLTYRADAAAALAKRGVSVFLYDYRGFGKSEGETSEKALHDDALAAFTTVAASTTAPVVLYGESIGGPYAAWTAQQSAGPCALILESSFPSIKKAAAAIYAPLRIDLIIYDGLKASEYASKSGLPTLIMHSRNDTIIPYRLAATLQEEIPDSKLITFDKSGHATIAWDERELWLDTVTSFVDQQCKQRTA